MLRKRRKLTLDVYDYAGNKKCTLYDSESNISGQAANVIIETQRNGWKELSFTIPSTCEQADGGQEDNFRLQFLKADFRIRAKYDDDKFDIFLISEPRVVHKAFSKDISVNAGHIAQLLKTKNLGLEFSDEEGNNVGTAAELLATILEGTGWEARNVATFKEKRSDKEKIRSLKASAKTGAFKLISNMCDLFEAKPIYYIKYEENQDTHVIEEKRLVDIVPMNPFSEPEEGGLPAVTNDKVVELQYGKNVKNVTRTLNTENMVTKLYCYGAYGDKVSGYCGIDEWHHDEYEFTTNQAIAAGEECRIYVPSNKTKIVEGSDVPVAIYYTRYFTAKTNIDSGTKLIWSLLDPASMLYVWDGHTAHRVYDERKSTGEIYTLPWNPQTDKTKTVVNEFSFLMDFDYYDSVGLLTDEMLQSIAEYQRNMPGYYKDERDAAAAFTEDITELANTIGSVNFVKLKTTGYSEDQNDWLQVSLDLDHTKDNDGVIYRTDYTVRKNKRFKWRVAKELKDNGDPVVDVASILYIIHANGTFDKIFLKQLLDANGNEIDYSLPEYKDAIPATLTLWRKYDEFTGASQDEVYLFQTRNVNGYLGAIEVADEQTVIALDSSTEIVTEDHPVFFVPGQKQNIPLTSFVGHAWQWVYHAWDDSNPYSENPSELYFCYQDDGDVTWHIVYRGFGEPADNNITGLSSGDYFYSYDKSALHRYNGSQWIRIKSGTEDERLVATFGTVIRSCMTRDRNFHGYYQYESIQIDSDLLSRYGNELPVGNYAIEDEWGTYHAFTTKEPMSENDWFCYDSTNKWVVYDSTDPAGKPVEQVLNQTLKSKDFRFDNVFRANNDLLADALWETGGLAAVTGLKPNAVYIYEGGGENDSVTNKERSSFIVTYPNVEHEVRNLPSGGATVFYYTLLNSCLGSAELTESNTTFTTPANTRHIRFVVDLNQHSGMECYIENSDVAFFSDEQVYFIIASNREDYEHMGTITNSGELKGIVPLMAKFNEYADKAYEQDYPALIEAQETVKEADLGLVRALGDAFREGYWQKTDYVDGDEDKLYNDGLENLEKIAKPEAKYSVDYLDLYTANDEGFEYAADAVAENILWPDLEADFAVHLLDPEIDISKWAFIDKISKCYDLPQKTQISINTDLSTIAQHSFTDVMTHIADVAQQASGKMEIYDRATSFNENGSLAAESLEGAINADKLKIFGGSSTWYTDDKGNMMFVSADGESAMALTGNGFSIADRKDEYGDWVWRTFGTGKGFTADVITTGTLQAERVITSKLMSMLGEGLDLSQNTSITLLVGDIGDVWDAVNRNEDKTIASINMLSDSIVASVESQNKYTDDALAGLNDSIASVSLKADAASLSVENLQNGIGTHFLIEENKVRLTQNDQQNCEMQLYADRMDFVNKNNVVTASFGTLGAYADQLRQNKKLSVGSGDENLEGYGWFDFIIMPSGMAEKWRGIDGYTYPLRITKQPVSSAGDTSVTLTVEAVVNNVIPSYQWQYSIDNGQVWNNIGGNTDSLSVSLDSANSVLRLYRCLVSNQQSVLTTNAVSVYSSSAPVVVYEYANSTSAGVVAVGQSQQISYQWYELTSSGWSAVSEATSDTCPIGSQTNRKLVCVVSENNLYNVSDIISV